jgi:hypothetical protein
LILPSELNYERTAPLAEKYAAAATRTEKSDKPAAAFFSASRATIS